jgi:XXXCH domain-containing protein
MKDSERKIRKNIPSRELPTQLRHLADALDGRTGELPSEWSDLPFPIAKLEVKGRAHGDNWALKIKIKAESASSPEPLPAENAKAVHTTPPPAAKNDLDYKQLKKKMKVAFKEIETSLAANKQPAQEALEAFLRASDLMMAFSGAAYGDAHYPAFRNACQTLRAAYEIPDMAALKAAYATLAQMKKDCHQACK